MPEVAGFCLFTDGSDEVNAVLHPVAPGFRPDDLPTIGIQDTRDNQFMVISRQEAGKNMKILFLQHRAAAEELRAGGPVTRALKAAKFICLHSIPNTFLPTLPPPTA